MGNISQRALTLIGAIAMVVGSFMTWVSVDLGFASFSSTGTAGTDGKLTAAAGVVIAVVGLAMTGKGKLSRVAAGIGLVAAVFAGLVLTFEYLDVRERIAETESGLATATLGLGLWVTAAAVAVAVVAITWSLMSRQRPQEA